MGSYGTHYDAFGKVAARERGFRSRVSDWRREDREPRQYRQPRPGAGAGVTIDTGKRNEQGAPILAAKYSGLHALRHFYASWFDQPDQPGGQGLSAKVVQERLGHATIAMTLDVYGHLFPRGDDEDEQLAIAAATLVGT